MKKIKIFGGRHANRSIGFFEGVDIRPSGIRVRKVLFDWLRFEIKGKKVIDLFSGSGILGFEAMSQGAKSVLCIEHNPKSCQQIEIEANRIGEKGLSVLEASIPCQLSDKFDVCFMDPPFEQKKLYQDTINWLNNILDVNGLLYIEANEFLGEIEGYRIHKQKKVSGVWMHLYQKVV